jgi:hypothetical protein
VLVATRETQGEGQRDFSWTVDGELVRFPEMECDCVDCGCRWSMVGCASQKATTTFAIAELPELSWEQLVDTLADSLRRDWGPLVPPATVQAVAVDAASEIVDYAEAWPAGTVLARAGLNVSVRKAAA